MRFLSCIVVTILIVAFGCKKEGWIKLTTTNGQEITQDGANFLIRIDKIESFGNGDHYIRFWIQEIPTNNGRKLWQSIHGDSIEIIIAQYHVNYSKQEYDVLNYAEYTKDGRVAKQSSYHPPSSEYPDNYGNMYHGKVIVPGTVIDEIAASVKRIKGD